MSRRRDPPPDDVEPSDEDDPEDDDEDDDEVEYFVEDELLDSVRTSVPKSEHSSQSSSSAPSTFVVVSDELSAPHISHWGIPVRSGWWGIKGAPRILSVVNQREPSLRDSDYLVPAAADGLIRFTVSQDRWLAETIRRTVGEQLQ
jgi:hypothetical protein